MAVIGAGPAGLVTAAALARLGVPWVGFEKSPQLGGKWASDVPPSLVMNTSVRRTRLRGQHWHAAGRFATATEFHQQLLTLAQQHALEPGFRCAAEVTSVAPAGDGSLHVTTADGNLHRAGTVVVACGIHHHPLQQQLAGTGGVPVEHSKSATTEHARGQRVLVVGYSTSGAELASDFAEAGATVTIAARHGAHLVPPALLGVPIDVLDGAVPSLAPWPVQRALLSVAAGVARRSRRPPGMPPRRPLFHEQPVLSHRLPALLRSGQVSLAAEAVRLDGHLVTLADGTTIEVDRVVAATGYEVDFPFLHRQPAFAGRPLYRRIVDPAIADTFFVGAIEPLGGILPVVDAQARWVADVIASRFALPAIDAMQASIDADERRLARRFGSHPRRQFLCDRQPYMRRLLLDRHRVPAAVRRPAAPLVGLKAN